MKRVIAIQLLWSVLCPMQLARGQSVTVDIDAQVTYQTMQGFGTSLRVFNDPHIIGGTVSEPITNGLNITSAEEDTILNLLYTELGLTRVRPATGEDGPIENPNDNGNPYVTDTAMFDFSWKKMDAHIDLVSRMIPLGVETFFPSTIKIEDWMTESNPEEYAEWAFAIIKRWRDMGYELPYYAIMNEPGYIRGGIWSAEYLRDCIKLLGPKLDTAGIATRIVVPDDLNANEAYARSQVIMADSEARSYVGALAYHLYGGSNANKLAMKQLGELYNVPIWMTEHYRSNAFDWGNEIHSMIADYGATAVDHMWGFFGQQSTNGAQLIALNYSGTGYTGYTIQKQYYVTGQYSRTVRPGAQRIEAISSNNDLKCTAYISDDSFVIVALNNHGVSQSVGFNVSGLPLASSISSFRTTGTENWAVQPDITPNANSFNTTLPANSITTFSMPFVPTGSGDDRTLASFMLNIFPNPSVDGRFIIDAGTIGMERLEVYDMTGKLLMDKWLQGVFRVEVDNISSKGNFLVRVSSVNGETAVHKIINN